MNSVILISMILAVFCASTSASVSGGIFRNPKYPGMCTLDESMIISPGATMLNPQGECAMINCFENGHATITRCMKQGMREGCTEGKVLYPDASYPDCCKREIKCDTFYYSPSY